MLRPAHPSAVTAQRGEGSFGGRGLRHIDRENMGRCTSGTVIAAVVPPARGASRIKATEPVLVNKQRGEEGRRAESRAQQCVGYECVQATITTGLGVNDREGGVVRRYSLRV